MKILRLRISLSLLLLLVFELAFGQEISIYRLMGYDRGWGETTGFVSLTDGFHWSDYRDSLVVSPENLGDQSFDNDNYHELIGEYRNRFLNRLHINENDSIFVYNMQTDSIVVYKVRNTKVTALLTPYGPNFPIEQQDYLIGFELERSVLSFGDYFDSYVYVGSTNPFQRGKMKPLIWVDTNKTVLPIMLDNLNIDTVQLSDYQTDKICCYNSNGLNFYIQNLKKNGVSMGRHFIVTDAKNESIIFNKVYFNNESAHLLSLRLTDDHENLSANQWTGQLFKGKPSIVTDFLTHRFGCSSLIFLDMLVPEIRVSCDNRH